MNTYTPVSFSFPVRLLSPRGERSALIFVSARSSPEGGWHWTITADAQPRTPDRDGVWPHRQPVLVAREDHDAFSRVVAETTTTENIAPPGRMPDFLTTILDRERLAEECIHRLPANWLKRYPLET